MNAQPDFSQLQLDERLTKALSLQGLTEPTEVQQQAIPLAMQQRDLWVSAETGSGKTAAYMLPTLQRMLTEPAKNTGTLALILLPTRELARQVYKQFTLFSKFSGLKACLITGGEAFKFQRALIRKNPELIIATPGRFLEHLEKGCADLNDLRTLVLDEADRMLDMGLGEEVQKIVDRAPKARQTLLLSATLNHRGIAGVSKRLLNNPLLVSMGHVTPPDSITQQLLLADDTAHKERQLTWLLSNDSYAQALVFCNTKAQVNRLGGLMNYHNLRAAIIHGDLTQDERNRVMDLLRRKQIDVLIASDVAARGIDVKGIDLVINFDMARSGDDYIHRVGRTGRAGETGVAISLVQASEWNLAIGIERYLKFRFERRVIDSLKGKYTGPKKVKASGKSVGQKVKQVDKRKGNEQDAEKKSKLRDRDRKNVGKRRKPAPPNGLVSDDGMAPLKRRSGNTEGSLD